MYDSLLMPYTYAESYDNTRRRDGGRGGRYRTISNMRSRYNPYNVLLHYLHILIIVLFIVSTFSTR